MEDEKLLVTLALRAMQTEACNRGDRDGDKVTTVDEILAAVRESRLGCDAPRHFAD